MLVETVLDTLDFATEVRNMNLDLPWSMIYQQNVANAILYRLDKSSGKRLAKIFFDLLLFLTVSRWADIFVLDVTCHTLTQLSYTGEDIKIVIIKIVIITKDSTKY